MQAMADGAVKSGLPRGLARTLVAATAKGAGMMALEDGAHPEALKDAVASPGGTTIAGLAVLESAAVRGALGAAVAASSERSHTMSKGDKA